MFSFVDLIKEGNSKQLHWCYNGRLIFPGSGQIEFEEFVDAYLKILTPPTTEELRIAFKGLDRNGDGQISFTEIQECLKHAGQPISDEELRGMFDHLDTDKSGAISYEGNFVCNLFQAGTE